MGEYAGTATAVRAGLTRKRPPTDDYDAGMWPLDALMAGTAIVFALALLPWRAVAPAGPPWPWLAWAAILPLLWGADRLSAIPMAQPLSGACLLMLMAGWPLAVLLMVPAAVLLSLAGRIDAASALHSLVWFGILPATVATGLGALARRFLPHHLFVYIFVRGFIATALAGVLVGAIHGSVALPAGVDAGDYRLARLLVSFGDAWLTGVIVAIFVAFRPQWLATYADRIYLPADRA